MTLDSERLRRNRSVRYGAIGCAILILLSLYAPFLCGKLPLACRIDGEWSFPFWRDFFAPQPPESWLTQCCNYLALLLPVVLLLKKLRFHRLWVSTAALLLALPFILVSPSLDHTSYRQLKKTPGNIVVLPVIPFDALETAGTPGEKPSSEHLLGCDDIGRDVASRLLSGGRVSLSVGLGSTLLALFIGCAIGLYCGYRGGLPDLAVMRGVEILMCFPTFLLLLILMSMLSDYHFEQSIPVVILVLGLTGWITVALLVRAQTLKERQLPYIESCVVSGVPEKRILFGQLLPNVAAPVLIAGAFGIAGAVLAESGLSFLGFGVKAPAPSWGELLRQAFDNPLDNWHLTLFPGILLFWTVFSFNLLGEGLRQVLSVKEEQVR